jgi:hypothetical protein
LPWLRVQALENPKLEDPEPVDRVTYHPHLGLWGMQCLISG